MKVTRLGWPQPVLNSGTGLNAGGRVPPGGSALTVLTSDGSNGRYWGENVRRITANGSNTLLGPDVNFAAGSNMTFSIASNTLTIHGQAGGSGSLTVQDEGTPLTTAADTLNFTGAGVTASGTGGTKTINVPGGSSDARPYFDSGIALDATYGDDFVASTLDAKWTETGAFDKESAVFGASGTWLAWTSSGITAMTLYQTGPVKETFEIIASYSQHDQTGTMVGVAIVSSTGTGVLVALRYDTSQLVLNNVASYAYSSDGAAVAIGGGNAVMDYMRGLKTWISLRKVPTALDGDVYFGRYSLDGFTWSEEVRYDPATFTYAKIGMGKLWNGAINGRIAFDRFNVRDAYDVGDNLIRTPSSGTSTQTASSQFSASFSPDKAADGNNATNWSASNGASDLAGSGLYWQNAWSVGQDINRVAFKERAGDDFGTAHLEITNGSGTTKVRIDEFVDGLSAWHVVDFPTVTGVTQLRIVADKGAGTNPGFIEVEAYLRS